MKYRLIAVTLLFLLANITLAAPTDRYEELTGEADDFDVEEKEWLESDTKIPALPKQNDWVVLDIDALPSNQQLYVAKNSFSVEKDYVIRYWFLIRSTGGGYNASFEGLRCSNKEYITYAYGREKQDPDVRMVTTPVWKDIGVRKQFNFRRALFENYFCSGFSPKSLLQIQQSVKGNYATQNPFDDELNP